MGTTSIGVSSEICCGIKQKRTEEWVNVGQGRLFIRWTIQGVHVG